MFLHARLAAGLRELAFEIVEQIEPAIEPALVDERGALDVGRHAVGITDDERRMRHAEETRAERAEPIADADE